MGMRPWERFVVIAPPACFLLLWFPLASLSICGLDQLSESCLQNWARTAVTPLLPFPGNWSACALLISGVSWY